MPSKKSARLAALTVAAVCSAASTVALTAPAHADTVAIHVATIEEALRVELEREPVLR